MDFLINFIDNSRLIERRLYTTSTSKAIQWCVWLIIIKYVIASNRVKIYTSRNAFFLKLLKVSTSRLVEEFREGLVQGSAVVLFSLLITGTVRLIQVLVV